MENGEIVRRVDDAFLAGLERGDLAGGAATGLVSEDHELIAVAEFPGRRRYRGLEGVVEFVRRWTEDLERFSIQRQELIDAGNGRVFSRHKQSAIGKGSGVPIEVEHFRSSRWRLGLWFESGTISTATKRSKPPDSRRKRS